MLQISLFTLAITVFFPFSICGVKAEAVPPPIPSPLPSQERPISILAPILRNLGHQELAMAASSFLFDSTWDGPSTLFAPTDASLQICDGGGGGGACSVSRILLEHIVPGFFPLDYLSKLDFGTKIETVSPGRCVTITASAINNLTKFFVNGAEITQPDLFNDGLIVVHRIQGTIGYLSPLSCNVERMSALFPPPDPSQTNPPRINSMMRLMLRDAALRLRNHGFGVLSLALRVKYAELVNLQNMTIFAVDDTSIFSGGQAYVSNVRFHIVPNLLLRYHELAKLPAGTSLDTLVRGETLVVTTAAGPVDVPIMRINYVRMKIPDVMYNLKMAVHSIYLPFPHIHPGVAAAGGGGSTVDDDTAAAASLTNDEMTGSCITSEKGGCAVAPSLGERITDYEFTTR